LGQGPAVPNPAGRALITGGAGLLASALGPELEQRGWVVDRLGRERLDITKEPEVFAAMRKRTPDVVFHCAAYTAVDRAESERNLAFRVNRDGAGAVARACGDRALMVYPSTDYVFSGEATVPYGPEDSTGPLNAYGASKLAGEELVAEAASRYLIARTSWLYGSGGRNFVDRMLELAEGGANALTVVHDQTSRPTWSVDLAEALVDLVEYGATGVYHVAGGGQATWFELAREAFALRGLRVPVEPVTTAAFGAPAPRPGFSVLDLEGTERVLGRPMRHWREALSRYLERGP